MLAQLIISSFQLENLNNEEVVFWKGRIVTILNFSKDFENIIKFP